MKNKSVFWVLIAGLLIMTPILIACTADTTIEIIDGKPVMKHEYDAIGFENCFVCHTGGLYPVPAVYAEMPLESCTLGGCHITMGSTPTPTTTTPTTTTPTTTPPTTTTTPPTTTGPAEPPPLTSVGHDLYAEMGGLCLTCHGPGMGEHEFPVEGPDDHTGRTNEECLDCHEVAVE
ncbi:hypothetical protein ES707_10240 [subsurface metagenome]